MGIIIPGIVAIVLLAIALIWSLRAFKPLAVFLFFLQGHFRKINQSLHTFHFRRPFRYLHSPLQPETINDQHDSD
jgi:hypothetical protein